jgi:hypothetical protein
VVHADGPLPTHRLRGGMRLTLLAPTWPMLTAMRDEWRSQLLERDPHDRIDPGDAERALEVLAEQPSMQPDALGTDWLPDWDPDNFQDYADETFDEDTRPPNGSSIAFLAEYEDKAVLFTGDAYPSVLGSSLARLKKERDITGQLGLDAVKLPHHGSRSNISKKLIDSVRCSRWLFSTNGSTHHHPHPEAVARVIDAAPAPTLYFNFRSDESEVWDDDDLRNDHDYQTEYPEDDAGGLVVRL